MALTFLPIVGIARIPAMNFADLHRAIPCLFEQSIAHCESKPRPEASIRQKFNQLGGAYGGKNGLRHFFSGREVLGCEASSALH